MSYSDLKHLGTRRLDAVMEIGLGTTLWDIQRRIARAVSKPRARVVVPSCNASGKTFLAARIALAFYFTYDDAKVITTSSTEGQLKDALWSEIRTAYGNAHVPIPGRLPPSDLWLRDGNNHFIKGTVARAREGFQGIHTAHKLVIADEASAMDPEVASGINALLATGDARLFIILNPTSDDSWAAEQASSPETEVIQITAFDTPLLSHMTNEEIYERWGQEMPPDRVPIVRDVPPGANLTTPEWLDSMVQQGMGPGTVEWTNRVLAEFWSASESQLISGAQIQQSKSTDRTPGLRVMGIDLAPYGDDENVIAYRQGNTLLRIEALPSIRPDLFWMHVARRVQEFKPQMLAWDADGVGAGSYTDAKRATKDLDVVLRPFRGGQSAGDHYQNTRSRAWWLLRRAFETQAIRLEVNDAKLEEQILAMRYSFTNTGKIKIESKDQMRRRGLSSPDRADAVMYAFADNPPQRVKPRVHPSSEEAMWRKDLAALDKRTANQEKQHWNPLIDAPDWF